MVRFSLLYKFDTNERTDKDKLLLSSCRKMIVVIRFESSFLLITYFENFVAQSFNLN